MGIRRFFGRQKNMRYPLAYSHRGPQSTISCKRALSGSTLARWEALVRMRRILFVLALCMLHISAVMFAQSTPRADVFLGYSYFRVNTAREIPAFSMNGGLGTLGLNINNH